MIDLSRAEWRKARLSSTSNGGCVEIAANLPDVVAVRDSTRPGAGAHVVSRAAFARFLAETKAGRFDLDGQGSSHPRRAGTSTNRRIPRAATRGILLSGPVSRPGGCRAAAAARLYCAARWAETPRPCALRYLLATALILYVMSAFGTILSGQKK